MGLMLPKGDHCTDIGHMYHGGSSGPSFSFTIIDCHFVLSFHHPLFAFPPDWSVVVEWSCFVWKLERISVQQLRWGLL